MKQAKKTLLFLVFFIVAALILIFAADRMSAAFRQKRMKSVLPAVYAASEEFSVSPAMILAVMETESDFRPGAVSTAGAMGLMQLMPNTFQYLTNDKLKENLPSSALTDPATNIRYGACYLSMLYAEFEDWPAALAAYNAGEGRVRKWLADETVSPGGRLDHIPFPETAQYVEKVLTAYAAYCRLYC